MKLKNLFFILVLIMIFSANVNAETISDSKNSSKTTFNNLMFADVPKDNKNFDAIYFLYNAGIVEGYAGKDSGIREYKAENKINRAEFLKLILEGTNKATGTTYEPCFPDITGKEWYATYVCQAKSEKIVNGYADGKFRPEQVINEAEALKILAELMDWKIASVPKDDPWYKPYMDVAKNKNILPHENVGVDMTRGDIAEIIFRNTQVQSLEIPQYKEDLVDELFYDFDIPYGGPLGPGGILGPGGPFGAAGAFTDFGHFADEKTGEFKFLDKEYFKGRYCYYSDEGDFRDIVYDILSYVTGGKVKEAELAGYSVDNFGIMDCYFGPIETDLALYKKEDDENYDLACWFDPVFSLSAQGKFERVFCYAEPKEPEWLNKGSFCVEEEGLNGNLCTTCYNDVFSDFILTKECSLSPKIVTCCMPGDPEEVCIKTNDQNCYYGGGRILQGVNSCIPDPCNAKKGNDGGDDNDKKITIDVNGAGDIIAGGLEKLYLEFFVLDENSNPVKGKKLNLVATSGRDHEESIAVKEQGNGVYKATFATKLAGDYILTVFDSETGTKNQVKIHVFPGTLDHVDIVDVEYPYENSYLNKSVVKVVSKDINGNLIPFSSINNNLTATSTFGTVKVSNDSKGIFTMEVVSNDWGVAELTVMNSGVSLGEKVEIPFFPIQLIMPKGIEAPTKQISAPLYIYFPKQYGELGSYDFEILYNPKVLKFSDFVDLDPNDKVTLPLFQINQTNGILKIWQPLTDVNESDPEKLFLGNVMFDVISVGDGSINVQNAVLKNLNNQVISYSDKFSNVVIGEFWAWDYKIKPSKEVCIDAFIFPLGGATEAEVTADIVQSNNIFSSIADSCNCDFYLNFVLNSVKNLTADDFFSVDKDKNGSIESGYFVPVDGDKSEADLIIEKFKPSDKCIPIYYVPGVDNYRLLGLSISKGGSGGIFVDNAIDNDGRTLAHELAHQLTKNVIGDQGDGEAEEQGANDAGNLMNYDDTGDDLTVNQCQEIEKNLP